MFSEHLLRVARGAQAEPGLGAQGLRPVLPREGTLRQSHTPAHLQAGLSALPSARILLVPPAGPRAPAPLLLQGGRAEPAGRPA